MEAKKRNDQMLERGMSSQGAFDHFVNKKKTTADDNDGNDINVASNSAKRSNKSQQSEALIGEPNSKERSVVILSKKSIEESVHDIATLQKKVIMKDLISVLKDDPRLAHKPLVYQL